MSLRADPEHVASERRYSAVATEAENTVVVVSANGQEPDHPDSVTYEDLTATLHAETKKVNRSDYVDAPSGNDSFAI